MYVGKAVVNSTLDIVGSFDTASFEYSLADSTNPQTRDRYQYAAVADFVEEAKVVGKKLYLHRDAKGPGSTDHLESTCEYDSSKRLVRDVDANHDETVYTAWDSSGRPISAVGNFVSHGATGIPIDIAYDDVALKMTAVLHTATTTGADWTNITTYDGYGNVLIDQVNVGTPSENRTEWSIVEYKTLTLW
jgi:hypothetical protein